MNAEGERRETGEGLRTRAAMLSRTPLRCTGHIMAAEGGARRRGYRNVEGRGLAIGPQSDPDRDNGITREAAVAFVRAMQEAANAHDVSRMAGFYAEDAIAISPALGELRGRGAIVDSWETLFTRFPDCTLGVSDVFTDGDRIAFLGTMAATDTGGWFDLAPTGSRIEYRETMLCTLRDGKIVREERIYDTSAVVERLERARLDREVQRAAEVQGALVPTTVLVGERWEAAGDSIPSLAIGGDFFELLELPSGDIAIGLGDVEGKGMPAALVAAMLHGMFVADAQAGLDPAETLRRMNRRLAARRPGARDLASRDRGSRFATFVCGLLARDGRFAYSSAGHAAPALVAREGVTRLTAGGPVLGAFAHADYPCGQTLVEPGENLLCFSDGVTEATNPDDEEFGDERLFECMRELAEQSAVSMLSGILGAVRGFVGDRPPSDDVTAVVARRR